MISFEISDAEVARAHDLLVREVLTELSGAVAEETRGLETDLEQITRLAVPGRLWRAWKSESFPKGGGPAREPSGTVFVNGGRRSQGAMTYFTQAGVNRNEDGFYMAIPLPAAGPRGRARDLSPGDWERAHGVKLRFVYRPGKAALLVLDQGVLSGKAQRGVPNSARRRARGRGDMTIPIFVLVPHQDFANAFSVEPIHQRRQRSLEINVRGRLDRTASF